MANLVYYLKDFFLFGIFNEIRVRDNTFYEIHPVRSCNMVIKREKQDRRKNYRERISHDRRNDTKKKKCRGIVIVVICMLYKQKRERKIKKKNITYKHTFKYLYKQKRKKKNQRDAIHWLLLHPC